jgi:hypothetical protein
MKKLLLTLVLAVVSSSAMAEWVGVGKKENFFSYVDSATIRKLGNMVKIWVEAVQFGKILNLAIGCQLSSVP